MGFLACRIAPPPGLLFVDGLQDSLPYRSPKQAPLTLSLLVSDLQRARIVWYRCGRALF